MARMAVTRAQKTKARAQKTEARAAKAAYKALGKMASRSVRKAVRENKIWCARCPETDPAMFGNNRSRHNGLSAYCKRCDALRRGFAWPPKPKKSKFVPKPVRIAITRIYKKEYAAYNNAKQRCTSGRNPRWKWYGGRHIKFLFKSFAEFLKDIGPCPDPKLTLDRCPRNRGNYTVGNVRWATMKQQAAGRRPKRPKYGLA
jgi:hypothetical protein